MTAADGSDVERSSLVLGQRLGSGGQGDVFALDGDAVLLKEYKNPSEVDGTELARLVDFRQSLPPSDRTRLDELAAWPLCRVVQQGRPVGFVMNAAPQWMTWVNGAGSRRLQEMQFLLRTAKPGWRQIVQPAPEQRRDLARSCAEAIAWFHAAGLVVGDISHANALWALFPNPAVYFLDCDGFRLAGSGAVLPQAATPDWNDPLAPSTEATVDTDAYKTALMVTRILTRDAYARPDESLSFVEGCLDDRREAAVRTLLAQAKGPRGTRPKPGEWSIALSERGTIKLNAVTRRPRPAVDRSMFDVVRDRKPIPLRKPAP
ncbi:hypothetical protein [Streptomyces sp. NBC_00525]|uniref:hypothetical protein n=1 Tax=Streptomyces sp. NBC_00525 TaxID=2903660 RepID=UPI002E8031D9|nr:hypothetical protein [Streptomyces sp. NBC_00525]WUC94719.1 hypothetical protein OG710_14545 [Streptomyces sp. NBC_00525]